MKVLAMIPARAGSKRVVDKNKKILGGKPLLAHTILAAQESLCCCDVIVSTDCPEIADIALNWGATVPYLRSPDLAQDGSAVMDAVLDLMQRYDAAYDSILLLQPTSPFRTPQTIRDAVALHQSAACSVVSVHASSFNPSWFKIIDAQGNLNKSNTFDEGVWSQERACLYVLNGCIYLASRHQLKTHQTFYSDATKPLILKDPQECLDIDTPHDWALAEKIIELRESV